MDLCKYSRYKKEMEEEKLNERRVMRNLPSLQEIRRNWGVDLYQ